jgi:hypothetical protein
METGTINTTGNVQFKVNSNAKTIAGIHAVTVTVKMTDYPTILKTQTLTITLLHPCLVATVTQQSSWPATTLQLEC